MHFPNLMETDCGQSNPISQLMQHVTEDQRFQESIGDPSLHETNNNNLLPPQSFRMHELMREIGHIEPHQVPMPSPSTFHVDVPNHALLGATWSTHYQNQFQEISHNIVPVNGLQESQNFMKYEYRPNEMQVSSHFESKFPESGKLLVDLQGTIAIKSLDELKDLVELEPEELSIDSQEIQEEPLPEMDGNRERKNIPDFTDTRHFKHFMNSFVRKHRKKEWERNHPNEKYTKLTREDILDAKEYSYVENNPMKDQLEPYKKGKKAYESARYYEAVLYFEEALRRNETTPRTWKKLSKALYLNDKDDKAISAMRQYLQYKPKCYEGGSLMFDIYIAYKCRYQACQWVFNWLKNNKSYKHLIPLDFTMDDQDTAELDENLLNSVKNIFLKAAQKHPMKVDANLQIMIGNLYYISRDFDKVADCKRTAIIHSKYLPISELYNMGYSLFYDNKPNEALDVFFEVDAKSACKINTYKSIGLVYLYLKNFREAIRYFRMELELKGFNHESQLQLQGDTLEDEFDLCVQLYCQIRVLRNNPKIN